MNDELDTAVFRKMLEALRDSQVAVDYNSNTVLVGFDVLVAALLGGYQLADALDASRSTPIMNDHETVEKSAA
jgi:hypothetical protein